MKKNVHGRGDTQISEEDLKPLYEGPAVGVELGWGGVYLCDQFPLEGSKRQTQAHSLEHHLVKEEEGASPSVP